MNVCTRQMWIAARDGRHVWNAGGSGLTDKLHHFLWRYRHWLPSLTFLHTPLYFTKNRKGQGLRDDSVLTHKLRFLIHMHKSVYVYVEECTYLYHSQAFIVESTKSLSIILHDTMLNRDFHSKVTSPSDIHVHDYNVRIVQRSVLIAQIFKGRGENLL